MKSRSSTPPPRGTGARGRGQRPKDAASLVLVRQGPKGPEILMGRRHRGHVFMPNLHVFPGGRVDPGDARVALASPLRGDVLSRLARNCTPARARALGVAAVRETFEETGLILGRRPSRRARRTPPAWRGFADRGLAPALDRLDYIYRAITPPGEARRFNARFFLAEVDELQGELREQGELESPAWVTLEAAGRLETAGITRLVLGEVARLLHDRPAPDADRRMPLCRYLNGRNVVTYE